MTIAATTRKAGPFSCNGATVAFPFTFKVFSSADVRVVHTSALLAETDLTLTTHYTVALNVNQNANPGGTVTTVATYATGVLITLASKVANSQPTDITNQGGFFPDVVEDALDRSAIQIQQLAEEMTRTVKVSISSALPPEQLIGQLATYSANAAASASASSGYAGQALTYKDLAVAAAGLAQSIASSNDPLSFSNYGHVWVNNTGWLTTTGDQTAIYYAGRRVRVVDSVVGVKYGTIGASWINAGTNITVTVDGGGVLGGTITSLAIGAALTGFPVTAYGLYFPQTYGKLSIPASAITPRNTGGATPGLTETVTNKVMLNTLDYSGTVDQYAQVQFVLPTNWNGGSLYLTAFIETTDAASVTTLWQAQLATLTSGISSDVVFGAAAVSSPIQAQGTALIRPVDIGPIPFTYAIGFCGIVLQLARLATAASDTYTGSARLLGLAIRYGEDHPWSA